MREYWITTHWPTPHVEPGQSRHVFVKERNVSLPKQNDFIFFRESITATANGDGRPAQRRCVRHAGGG